MAHVTGGGLPGNLPRVLPPGCRAVVRRGSWRVPPIFSLIERLGAVPRGEMDRTFNNGIGFVLVVARARVDRVLAELGRRRAGARVIGAVVAGERGLSFAERDG
jgi:phosphoribosylformylglycinamidine cyclo-ligase